MENTLNDTMSDALTKLAIWTEGFDKDWNLATGDRERIAHGSMSPDALNNIIQELRFTHATGTLAETLIVVQSGPRTINLTFDIGGIQVSDPNDQNYQNIAIEDARLQEFLEEIGRTEKTPEEIPKGLPPKLEWGVALCAVVVLAGAVLLASNSLKRDAGFIPYPEAVKIENANEIQHAKEQYAGIYTTGIDDGEMLIELEMSGNWGYYDLAKTSSRDFSLITVDAGTFTPAYEGATEAIVTDKRFVFYPKEEGTLEFLQRQFKRSGDTREDLPFVKFPKMEK